MNSNSQSSPKRSSLPRDVVWGAFALYDRLIPLNRGKHRLSMVIRRIFGSRVQNVSGVYVEVTPWSGSDDVIIAKMDEGTAVHLAMDEFLSPGSVFIDVGA